MILQQRKTIPFIPESLINKKCAPPEEFTFFPTIGTPEIERYASNTWTNFKQKLQFYIFSHRTIDFINNNNRKMCHVYRKINHPIAPMTLPLFNWMILHWTSLKKSYSMSDRYQFNVYLSNFTKIYKKKHTIDIHERQLRSKSFVKIILKAELFNWTRKKRKKKDSLYLSIWVKTGLIGKTI